MTYLKSKQFPLHIHVSALFVLLTLAVGGLLLGVGYLTSRTLINTLADDLTLSIGRETNSELQRILQPVETVINVLALDELSRQHSHSQRMSRLDLMRNLLDNHPSLSSVYVGYENGDFFMVRQLKEQKEQQRLNAPAQTRYMVQSIEQSANRGRYVYLDVDLNVLSTEDRPDYPPSYDPRKRDWYKLASTVESTVFSGPYLFFSDRQVGITMALASRHKGAVVGADIQLQTLNANLSRQKVTPGSQLALIDAQGHMFAHENTRDLVQLTDKTDRPALATLETFGVPVLKHIQQNINFQAIQPSGWLHSTVDSSGETWKVSAHKLEVRGAEHLLLLIAVPQQELLAGAYAQRRIAAAMTLVIVVLSIPITWLVARSISRPLITLTKEAEAIRRFEFKHPFELQSNVLEVSQLSETIAKMKQTIRQFLELSNAIAAESNFEHLLPRLLGETISAAYASCGILYLSEPQRLVPIAGRSTMGNALSEQELQQLQTLDLGPSTGPKPHALEHVAGPLMALALRSGEVQEAPLSSDDMSTLGLIHVLHLDSTMYATAVPLMNRRQELTGAMLLISMQPMDKALLAFVAEFSGTAAVTLEAQSLIKEQKELFESFIRLMANAIDAKSSHTGGHCARVPDLVKMLAQATCAAQSGPYQNYSMSDADWETLRIAGWLHDCGKVTTPEYVVDKATKLETIYNRIHEVRTRFEVLKRDAHLRHLERLLSGSDQEASLAQLQTDWQGIDEDFTFVAKCNDGSETLTPQMRERLCRIAERTWQRTLDNQLGLSQQEASRMTSSQPLPVTEKLLSDRPEQRIERTTHDVLPQNNPWGIRMVMPELLYNQGELYNLCVQRGTLTDEERYKINDHIVQTEIMLRELPFPRHLKRVPSIAAAHHEKLDGTGYPKKLHAEHLSPEARMLAIADIFEALTASDRPYKKGLKLSESVRIMAKMRDEKHIDPDLFEIFLCSGVFRRYAQQNMPAHLVDDVDVQAFLSTQENCPCQA
jgi:HD-GYP domain-containing protein (c-di-GMP phosphodiesterase class II)